MIFLTCFLFLARCFFFIVHVYSSCAFALLMMFHLFLKKKAFVAGQWTWRFLNLDSKQHNPRCTLEIFCIDMVVERSVDCCVLMSLDNQQCISLIRGYGSMKTSLLESLHLLGISQWGVPFVPVFISFFL